MRFRSKHGTDPLDFVVHITSGAFQKAIRYGTYHFCNRKVPVRNRHKNRAGTVGSSVNRTAIGYGFWGAPIIDPVKCEHGLRLQLQGWVFKSFRFQIDPLWFAH